MNPGANPKNLFMSNPLERDELVLVHMAIGHCTPSPPGWQDESRWLPGSDASSALAGAVLIGRVPVSASYYAQAGRTTF